MQQKEIIMSQEHFEKWSEMAKKLQEPFQAIAELNIKTLQELTYLKPEDMTRMKPEEWIEKQMNQAIENGHKTLDYMQKSFQILEKAMSTIVKEGKKAAENKKVA